MSELASLKALLAEAVATQNRLAGALVTMVSLEQQSRGEGYVGVGDLVTALGPAFSERKILDDLRSGMFKPGRDYINLSNGTRPSYGFKVSRIRAVYETAPEKRRIYV